MFLRALASLTLPLALVVVAACNAQEGTAATQPTAAAASETPAGAAAANNPLVAANDQAKLGAGATAPAAPAEDPCDALKKGVCQRLGEESEACGAYQLVAGTLPVDVCKAAVARLDAIETSYKTRRAPCIELETKLCADLGATTETCARVRDSAPSIPVERCADMLEHYKEVLDSLKAEEARNQPLTPEQQAKLVGGTAPSFGPADAKVTIVAFSDFQCPYCAEAGKVTEALREKYKDRVRFVFRNFPLPFHPNALPAAQAALAAAAEGKFWPFHDLMFANQEKLDRDGLLALAKQAGLDEKALGKALDAGTYKAAVEADLALGHDVQVQGTPTFYVNGAPVPNPTDLTAVAAQIDAALAK